MEPIGYKIKEISKLFNEAVKTKVLNSGLSITQFHILNILEREENINQKEICKKLFMKAPTISITLTNMEKDELIIRTKSQKDNRSTYISLSAKGKEEAYKYKRLFKEVDEIMESAVNDEELERFYNSLDKMKVALEEVKKNA